MTDQQIAAYNHNIDSTINSFLIILCVVIVSLLLGMFIQATKTERKDEWQPPYAVVRLTDPHKTAWAVWDYRQMKIVRGPYWSKKDDRATARYALNAMMEKQRTLSSDERWTQDGQAN